MQSDPHISKLLALSDDDEFWVKRNAEVALQREQERKERDARHLQRVREQWKAIPYEYRKAFDPSKSKIPRDTIQHCRSWQPGGFGVGLTGTTGLGKTRLVCAMLRQYRESHSWLYLPAFEMSNYVGQQWSDDDWTAMAAVRQLRRAKRVDILVLDDLADERGTEASTAFLKELVEHRTSRSLPILWTSNADPEALARKHGTQGTAIVRRLGEFCTIF